MQGDTASPSCPLSPNSPRAEIEYLSPTPSPVLSTIIPILLCPHGPHSLILIPSTVNQTGQTPALVKTLHHDLVQKYQIHGSRIEQIWRSLDQSQRDKAVKAGALRGCVLADPTDQSMGNIYKIIPEWNLRDLTQESAYLPNHLKHRATRSLSDQYREGVNSSPGDHTFILGSMRVNHLPHANPFRNCFTLFIDEDQYGQSYEVIDPAKYREVMAGLSTAVNAGLCVPQSTGELILQRQMYLLQALNVLVDDILKEGSTQDD